MSDERRDYAILISLYMREEAEVMASALRAEGIDAFLGNWRHATADWGYTIALGGLQVMVPRARLLEAKDVLRARVREAAENPEGEPVERHDRYKVWVVVAGWAGMWAFFHWADGAYEEQYLRMEAEYWAAQEAREEEYWSDYFPLPASDPLLKHYCRDMPRESVQARVDGEIRTVPCAELLE